MIRYLAGDDALEVPSPTFTLAQSYDLPPFPLVHADLYRINDAERAGGDRAVAVAGGDGGADRMAGARADALPEDRIDIALSHRPALGSTARAAEITGYGKARRAGRAAEGAARSSSTAPAIIDARRQRMAGDASTRSYARLIRDDGIVILMNSPRRPDGPRSMTANPTAPRCISPRTSSPSSPSPTACARTAFRRRRSTMPTSTHGFLITEDFGSEGVIEGDPPRADRRAL